jgi:hypothetical protein
MNYVKNVNLNALFNACTKKIFVIARSVLSPPHVIMGSIFLSVVERSVSDEAIYFFLSLQECRGNLSPPLSFPRKQ